MAVILKNFIEIRFPEDISYGSIGGPVYSTDVVETNNAWEYRNSNWEEGRLEYNVSYGVRDEIQLNKLLTFFRARRGKAVGFRFKDWSDYKATKQLLAIGDGSSRVYQLFKTYNSGNAYEIRKIFKPVENTIKLYTESSQQNFKADYSNGLIELINPLKLNEKLYTDFEFDVPVRFDNDSFHYSNIDKGIYSCENLKVKEIKLFNKLIN